MLSFSTVTSVNENTESKSDYDYKYRVINRNIVKNVNRILKDKYNYDFRVWQARKYGISEAWGIIDLSSSSSVDYKLRYGLVTDYSVGITSLNMSIYPDGSVTDKAFGNLFKENPLPYQCKMYNRNLVYEKIIRFSDMEAQEIDDKLVQIIKNAIDALHDFTKAVTE